MKTVLVAALVLLGQDLSLEIEQERMARNDELRSPMYASPLTAVDQVMIEPEHSAYLFECKGKLGFAAGSGCNALVEIRFAAGRFLAKPLKRTKGIWGPGTPFARELSITPGKSDIRGRLLLSAPEAAEGYALFFSLQGNMGRAMLHNTRSETLVSFEGLRYFDVDPKYRYVVRIEPAAEQETIEMATTQGLQKRFKQLGTVRFEVPEGKRRLSVFAPLDSPQHLFVPFRDATNGQQTYSMGRYLYLLEGPEPATYILDFNRAFNPYCAYSHYYNCPYPPEENHLDVPIPAGEKLYTAGGESLP